MVACHLDVRRAPCIRGSISNLVHILQKSTRVVANPERPPEIDFSAIKSKVVDKSAVDNLEKAYKALAVKYPGDNNVSQQIAAQESEHKEKGQKLVHQIREETKEANELLKKFDDMIPFDQMHREEYILTFPDWNDSPQNPVIYPREERPPGKSKKEYHEISETYNDANYMFK